MKEKSLEIDVKLVGLNFRMDEIESTAGLYQLDKLNHFIKD